MSANETSYELHAALIMVKRAGGGVTGATAHLTGDELLRFIELVEQAYVLKRTERAPDAL